MAAGRILAAVAVLMVAVGSCRPPQRAAQGCIVTGDGPVEDRDLARRMCARVEQRFAQLLGARAPSGTIVLTSTGDFLAELGQRRWRLQWPTTARLLEMAKSLQREDGDIRQSWETVLPHELGHVMLAAHFYGETPSLIGNEYGTPLPDWIDEGVAVWMESDADRAERLRQAALLSGNLPVRLETVLATDHPLAADSDSPYATRIVVNAACFCAERPHPERAQRIVYRYYRDGRTAAETTYVAGSEALDEPEARFYAQSYALIAYLHHRGGSEAIDKVLRRAHRHPMRREGLLEGVRGMPASHLGVESDWRAWLAHRIRTARNR